MQNKKNFTKRIVDVGMTVLLLCLMAYQVTGEAAHEWIGMGMTVLVIVHQILNRKWYGALLKGKYNPLRTVMTVVNILLIASFVLTAFCGMSMSGHAVPFLYGMAPISFVRRMHLSMSHWSFVLMGLHLGLHIRMLFAGVKMSRKVKMVTSVIFCAVSGIGFWLFLRNNMPAYLFFKVPFAFLDYEKAGGLVFLENILMLLFWAFIGCQFSNILIAHKRKDDGRDKNPLIPVIFIMAAVIIGLVMNMAFAGQKDTSGAPDWGSEPQTESVGQEAAQTVEEKAEPQAESTAGETAQTGEKKEGPGKASYADPADIQDGFILIKGGSYLMGSPETENWRIDDETQHEVELTSFYMDPYETIQEDYERLTGSNPSSFTGERLPVDNVSWLDAVLYANAKSKEAGLDAAYTIDGDSVTWDRSANGYRLPTEAEWEYACRTSTMQHLPGNVVRNWWNSDIMSFVCCLIQCMD